jgi:hypothetical protein
MKGLKTLAGGLAAAALLVAAAPASAKPPTAKPPAFTHYVACGLSQNAKSAHVCQRRRKKGAFFRSNKADVFYTVCVRFPTKRTLCAPRQEAVKGTLYVNKITSTIPGMHTVSWFVEGKRVGLFKFRVPG